MIRSIFALAVTAVVATPDAAAQNRIVLPAGLAGTEAFSSHSFPWGAASTPSFGRFGIRVQMAYDSVHFTSQGWVGAHPVQRLRWRADGLSNPSSTGGVYQNVVIDLSTASVDQRSLSKTFAQNHGADRATVYSGSVRLAATGNQSPNIFYVDLTLSTPFLYDPAAGDLLIDVRVSSGWSGGTAARTDTATGSRSVAASMIMNRVSAQAISGDRLRDVGQVMSVDFGGGQQATTMAYGQGCPAVSGLALQGVTRPLLGSNFDVAVQNLPSGTMAGLLYLATNPQVPPVSLTGLGAPGCVVHVDLGQAVIAPYQPLGTIAITTLPVPAQPALAGQSVFLQGIAVVPGANALGVLTSNGLEARLGTL